MGCCVFQCDVPHQWIVQRQVIPVSVYCDEVGCRVMCLWHGIPVLQISTVAIYLRCLKATINPNKQTNNDLGPLIGCTHVINIQVTGLYWRFYSRYIVSVAIDVTLMGVCVVFILLISQNLQSLLAAAHADLSFCYWLIIVSVILAPLTWLGSPKDFWSVALF